MKSYNISCEISEPVLLNCWKHHAGFVRSKIKEYRSKTEPDIAKLQGDLLLIGESLMDLYLGEMTPDQIASSIISFGNEKDILNRFKYACWLRQEGKDYRIIDLEDRSKWTLRLGEHERRYIHVHPSRYSPYSIRVRSSALKSAIIHNVVSKPESESPLGFINRIRKEYLDLPPLKNLKSASSLLNLIEILE